jgi:hypothetical protein
MGGDHVWACEDYLCLVVSFVKDYPCSPSDIHIERTKILQRAKHERRAGGRGAAEADINQAVNKIRVSHNLRALIFLAFANPRTP